MKSEFIDLDFYYWWAEGRYRGHFQLDWIFIKDINFKKFQDITAVISVGQQRERHPVTRAIDGTELEWLTCGREMMKIFKEAKTTPNIFNDFSYMDQRENYLRNMRNNKRIYSGNHGGNHNYNNNYYGSNNNNGGNNSNYGGSSNSGQTNNGYNNRGGNSRQNYGSTSGGVSGGATSQISGYNSAYSSYGYVYPQSYYPYSYPVNYNLDQNSYAVAAAAAVAAGKGAYPPTVYPSVYYPTFPNPSYQSNTSFYTQQQQQINQQFQNMKISENPQNNTQTPSTINATTQPVQDENKGNTNNDAVKK